MCRLGRAVHQLLHFTFLLPGLRRGGYLFASDFNIVLLANAHLQQKNLDEACAAGTRALELGTGLQSARTIRYIRDLRLRMNKFSKEPVVADFQAQAHELLPASDPRPS
jgi:hypothetical protein